MFKIFIEATILKKIADSEKGNPKLAQSMLFRLLSQQKVVYVSSTEEAWIHAIGTEAKINANTSQAAILRELLHIQRPCFRILHPSSSSISPLPRQKGSKNCMGSYA